MSRPNDFLIKWGLPMLLFNNFLDSFNLGITFTRGKMLFNFNATYLETGSES